MKLKKIASLMLAGIMAVSMLAACGEGKDNGGNAGSSSSQPTTSGVVAGVEAGIKSWNKDLDIKVESSTNMVNGVADLFKKNEDKKVDNDTILDEIAKIFNVVDMGGTANYDLMQTTTLNVGVASTSKQDIRYVIIPVTKANGDVNTYAGNVIGERINELGLKDIIDSSDGKKLDVDYKLYVTSEKATMADNSVGTYVIGVLFVDYSEHIA